MTDAVLTETRDGVLLITLNRPDAMNAVNEDLAAGLLAAAKRLDDDPALTAGVLSANGRGFCAGMDLKAFATEGVPPSFFKFLQAGSAKPLIAAIEGFALAGGLEIALTCDLLVASEGAKLGIPETKVGLFAAGGAMFRLPRRVPLGVALEMALTGDPILAERAHEVGLVARVAKPGAAASTAIELAEKIARNAPLGVAASKKLIRDVSMLHDEAAWEAQQPLKDSVFSSDDSQEGSRAFAEKRAPQWSGE
jgi:enoyl-CoA hydratase